MKNLRVVETCTTCKYCFVKFEYDENDLYFCTFGADKRPKCGSVAMGENMKSTDDVMSFYDKWEKWAEGREVKSNNTCDNYEIKKN